MSKKSKKNNHIINNLKKKNKRINKKHKYVREDFGPFDFLKKILDPIVSLGVLVEILIKFITTGLPKLLLWIIMIIPWFFKDFLNPFVWIQDILASVFVGLQLFVQAVLDGFMAIVRKSFDLVFGPIANGIWADDFPDKSQSKCYKMPDCSVPYPVLFGTIILPPLGVFMELGLKGWLNILICAVLTLLYYFPGLIYALILLYC